MRIGLAVMRLQPLTKGHESIINQMLTENDKAFLVIGSANTSDERNPYTYAQRKAMVESVFKSETANGRLTVLGANDIHNPPKWAAYIQSLLPEKATHYYCGQGQDADLFRAAGFEICEIARTPSDISATGVRTKMAKGDNSWQQEVPAPIITFLLNNGRQHG